MTKRIVRSNKRYDSIRPWDCDPNGIEDQPHRYKPRVGMCPHRTEVDESVAACFRWCETCTDWIIQPVPYTEVTREPIKS